MESVNITLKEIAEDLETKPKAKPRSEASYERIPISKDSLARLDKFIEQISQKQKGIRIKRSDLLNWIITSKSEVLSQSEEKQLTDLFYDEEKFLRYACDEIKRAKIRGETLTLDDILDRRKAPKTERKPRATKAKDNNDAPITGVDQNGAN